MFPHKIEAYYRIHGLLPNPWPLPELSSCRHQLVNLHHQSIRGFCAIFATNSKLAFILSYNGHPYDQRLNGHNCPLAGGCLRDA